ncbi:hypothetical protein RHSIM_Rhsim03G0086000 [Rhododendron simsii]|uniref:Uncharacterized protein n=1 Tax=Rhododendron simsii TaxID=118357 RepID=A0A834LUT1_RHOSS|nr:hypothetical protein RHSIM_Rhsim03G0086000 [Rhododendron simsii]
MFRSSCICAICKILWQIKGTLWKTLRGLGVADIVFEDSSAWYDWFFRCVYHYRNDDGAEKQEEFGKSSSEAHDDAEQKDPFYGDYLGFLSSLLHLFELNGEIHEDSELQSLLPPGPPRRGGLCKNSGNPRAKVEGPLE